MKKTLSIWLTSIFLHLGGSPFRKYGCTKTKIPGGGGGQGGYGGPKVYKSNILENRRYPILLTLRQTGTYPLNYIT